MRRKPPLCLKAADIVVKAKKTHGFNSCIVISLYQLQISSIKRATIIKTPESVF